MVVIPTTSSSPHYEMEVELDGKAYRLTFEWNGRDGAWYLSLADAAGVVIRGGIRLVPNWPLLRKVADERRPPGDLVVLEEAGGGITRDNLGTDAILVYGSA